MLYPKIPLAQSVIDIFQTKGIQHIVISPGSRNAPLTIGFTNNPNFKCYSIPDERCAAFFAMGMAQQLQEPVVVLCTSGSAVLNFHPAVAEAYYSLIPLIVVSADRPLSKIDIGDGQTIRQQNVLTNHTVFNANLTEDASESNDLLINQAIDFSIIHSSPVHINVPFEEPLYEVTDVLEVDSLYTKLVRPKKELMLQDIIVATNVWNTAKKKMILVGSLHPHSVESRFIEFLSNDPSVIVLTETTSNLHHSQFISSIDQLIHGMSQEEFRMLSPDVLLTFGGLIVSKKIKAFLRTFSPYQHWHVDPYRANNTFGVLTHHFKCSITSFFDSFIPYTKGISSNYQESILYLRDQRVLKHQQFVSKASYSDFKVFDRLFKNLKSPIQLHIANSSPIRYAQLFSIHEEIQVFCNRGTSGIDGSMSTAVGASMAQSLPVVMITGDVSFFYDSNALWNNYVSPLFKVILINNQGGGIFRILPGHQETETFHTYFETQHTLDASHISKMYGLRYFIVDQDSELENSIQEFIVTEGPALLEIKTPCFENDLVLSQYFQALI